MAIQFADLHCHPSMKAYSKGIVDFDKSLNDPDKRSKNSIWHTNSKIGGIWRHEVEGLLGVAKYKQSDMTQLEDGNANLIVLSITPPEIGFFEINRENLPRLPAYLNLTNEQIINLVTEFGIKRAAEIRSDEYDYFNDLNREYNYVRQLDGKVTLHGKKYLLAKRGERIDDLLRDNPECVIVVLSIEGGHALISGPAQEELSRYTPFVDDLTHPLTMELLDMLRLNITKVKSWNGGIHCPLFLTLSHHFWNLMAGHAASLANILTGLLDQRFGINRGMTEVGKEVVKLLISRENGPRILIDTRHLSAASRKWYYQYVRDHNASFPEDVIPVLSSHTAANTYSFIQGSDQGEVETRPDGSVIITANGKYQQSAIHNNWSINLSDEEIKLIHDSGGLIGISMDQRVLSGNKLMMDLKSARDRYRWAQPFYNQVKYIYQLLYEYNGNDARKAVGCICIGSDFDGIINPLEHFGTALEFNSLQQELYAYVSSNSMAFKGITAKEVVEAVMFENARRFIGEWFV